jgi:hypothetical protein
MDDEVEVPGSELGTTGHVQSPEWQIRLVAEFACP